MAAWLCVPLSWSIPAALYAVSISASSSFPTSCAVTALQTFQNAEKLGLYGKNPVGNTDYFIAAGDSGLITTGGTIGGLIIAGQTLQACMARGCIQ